MRREKARRFVFIREKFDRRIGQKILTGFRHQVICTNLQTPAEEMWRFCNQRCTLENRISELKDGFAMDQQSQHTLFKNTAYATIKVVACNLLNWMKAVVLPRETRTYRSGTLRRKIFCVPGNVIISGRYIRHAANRWLEDVVWRLHALYYIIAAHLWAQVS